jgi:hypothetical protein
VFVIHGQELPAARTMIPATLTIALGCLLPGLGSKLGFLDGRGWRSIAPVPAVVERQRENSRLPQHRVVGLAVHAPARTLPDETIELVYSSG